MFKKFYGIIPPVPTLLKNNSEIDKEGMQEHIEFLISSGVHGLFFLGSGGEFSQMHTKLRKEVAEFSLEIVDGRVPVLIGTGSCSTSEVISLSIHAKKFGADGVVVVNPYYSTLSRDNLFNHYAEISKNVELPIILYNFPNFTGQDLSPDFVTSLAAEFSNIVGIKETTDLAGHIREMILQVKKVRPEFSVFCGYDDHLLNTMSLGGDGAIPASANFIPELTVGLYESFQRESYGEAIDLHKKLAPLPQLYNLDSPFVNVIKEAIKLRGLAISTYSLPPTRNLTEKARGEVIKIMDSTLQQTFHNKKVGKHE